MRKNLDDITLYYVPEDHISYKFTIRQNLVSGLYVSFLNYKPKGTSRISVTIGDPPTSWYAGSILCVGTHFDKNAYWQSSPDEQNQTILDTVHRVAIACADKYGWDKSFFETAYKKVLESNFIYSQEQPRKLSRDKKHQASLLFEKNGETTIISVLFRDNRGELMNTVELLKSYDASWLYEGITRNNKWFNNREFGVYLKNEELVIKAALDNPNSETIINPGKYSRERLEAYLGQITYDKAFVDKIRQAKST